MNNDGIKIESIPELKDPILIAGFYGWGNALDISTSMSSYLIQKLKAKPFAKIEPDGFYRYDESRPLVIIEEGILKHVLPPGGYFHSVKTGENERDLIILKAHEPQLRWSFFVEQLLELCETFGVETIITLGGMYDNVLHTDMIISGIASSDELSFELRKREVLPISYQGPSAIHSTVHANGKSKGLKCFSLWCHCPYYLQGETHFGLLVRLGELLSSLGNFELDTAELEDNWKQLNKQIFELIDKNPELQGMISELRKAKVRGSWESLRGDTKKDDKVIHLSDFKKPI